ncbi:LutC/YkgG family protein [Microbispora bryophytorum]|uniref:LUD domain-containing protein n=1 Tax=Microbispora bryophytorum subsp. camponoti TaxID=1677852 RepID=A0ABR8KXB4_9ACTN|nr:LUD domain-containing protein [Microbispora camponoti]MBD3142052.1 LUD domain-containing protein [Microbispora camponoti]
MSSRDLILARVRRALAGAPDVEITRAYRGPSQTPGDIRLFEERVRDYRAVVHLVDEAGVPERVALSLAGRGARRVVVPAGFPPRWLAAADVEAVADDPPLSAADLDAVDGVVTTCAVAIAETGTIVLDTGPGQGRRALTLVPDYHLCVVRAAQVVAGVPDAVARLAPARPQTWISGPSATSDIELNRVEGVHGPRTLEVLIVD